jgi:voltage-gated sodium channel
MYFVPFVMISSYIVLNVVVGVVVNATSDISEDDNISMKDKIKAKKVTNTEISEQINELKEHILRLEAKLEENKKDESKIQN